MTEPVHVNGRDERSPKSFLATTHRACAPAQTLERIRPLLSRAGVTRLSDITGLDRIGITVVTATRPNARSLAAAAGKGFDATSATVSACMEAIELHHAEHVELDITVGTYAEMAERGPVVDPARLPMVSDSVWTEWVELPWTYGFDLISGEQMALPLELACLPNQVVSMLRAGGQLFQAGSNGLASGNTLLEAITAALCEVVERDAHALAMFAARQLGREAPLVDLAALPYPRVAELLDRLAGAGQWLAVRDVTSDAGVPCYVATLMDAAERNVGAHAGYGAHLDPDIALVRAITEAIQARAIYISGSRDDMYFSEFRRWKRGDVASIVEPQLAAAETAHAAARTDLSNATFEEDVHLLLDRLKAIGCEHAVMVDLTRPDFGIPVVKVVVPGLEGYCDFANYAPGPRARALASAQ